MSGKISVRHVAAEPVDPECGRGAWHVYEVFEETTSRGFVEAWSDGEDASYGDDRAVWDRTNCISSAQAEAALDMVLARLHQDHAKLGVRS